MIDRAATITLWLVGGSIVAVAVARRVQAERIAAGQREPFTGLAAVARRIQARRGGFGSSVTGIDLRSLWDPGFFGGFFGGGPMADPFAPSGPGLTTLINGDTGMGVDPSTPATPGPANTAPQDFNEAQFAAQVVSQTAPGVQAAVAAFSLNPIGVVAAVIDALIDGVLGGRRAPNAPSPTVSAIVSGARGILGTIAAITGIPGVGAPGATPGLSAVPGLAGVPGLSPAVGAMVGLSMFLGRKGVEVEAGRRAAADPGFRAAVAAEVARQRADPARFFGVLADPKAFPDALRGVVTATVVPEITFAAPRASDPIDAPTPTGPSTGPAGSPGGQGEPGGPPAGTAGDAPASGPPSGPPGGVPGGPGQVGGLAAQGEGPGFTAGFTGDLSLGLSPTSAPAPTPSSEPDPGLVSEPADADTSGGGGGGGGGGGVGAGGGGESGPGGEGP